MARCPLCGRALARERPIVVCGDCHGSLEAAGGGSVRTTSEFAAVAQVQAAPPGDAIEHTDEYAPTGPTAACTWCGKSASAARKLLSHGQLHICNECVAFCADILAAELGDDWGRS
jgi:hypothetical protein